MTDDMIRALTAAASKRPYRARGAVYRQLRAKHAEIVAIIAKDEPSWRVIAEAMASAGVLGRHGKPPNHNSLPKVWHRVCQDLAADEAMRLTGVRPSKAARRKLPANWLPSGYPQPNAPPPTGGVHQGGHLTALSAAPHQRPAPAPAPENDQDSSRPAPGSVAAIREEMNLRSGRKANGEPKF